MGPACIGTKEGTVSVRDEGDGQAGRGEGVGTANGARPAARTVRVAGTVVSGGPSENGARPTEGAKGVVGIPTLCR